MCPPCALIMTTTMNTNYRAMSGTPSPRRLDPGTGDSYGAGGRSPAEGSRAFPGSSVLPAAGSNLSLTAASAADSDLLVALRFELLTAAALEAGVYMARRPPGVGLGAMTQSSSGAAQPSVSPVAASVKDPAAFALRAAHVPARRLARTVLCLGSADGPHFGASALRVIRAQVASSGDGLDVLSYWWSNAVHMRAMLGGLSLAAAAAGVLAPAAGGMGLAVAAAVSAGGASIGSLGAGLGGAPGAAPGSEHWAAAALVPELKRLERAVFQDLLGRMWERVLLPTVLGRAGGARAAAPAAATKRALQEAAIKKWFEGLEAVCAALTKQVAGGHSALLRQQVLLAALKRVDLLLFAHLLGGADQPGVADLLTDYDPHGSLAVSAAGPAAAAPGSAAAAVAAAAAAAAAGGGVGTTGGGVIPQLDEASLPFAKGVLTFGGGMSVKMTVTRLQQWAAGQPLLGGGASGADAGLAGAGTTGAVGAAVGAGAGPGPLFPLLRAAADLLMMPKEMLVDRAVRLDVGAALSMRSVLHILERFQVSPGRLGARRPGYTPEFVARDRGGQGRQGLPE